MGIPKGVVVTRRCLNSHPLYYKAVGNVLRMYPIIKRKIEQKNEERFPSCTALYEENKVQETKRHISSTESFGISRAQEYEELRPVEKALEVLNREERELIEQTYFQMNLLSVDDICGKLGYSRRTYFRVKRGAIEKIAFMMEMK